MTQLVKSFAASFGAEAVAASTPYVVVDLDDVTNYPHTFTSELHILGLIVNAETQADGTYDLWFGVITEVDADNGTAEWFDVIHFETRQNPTDDEGHLDIFRDYTLGGRNADGMNLLIESGASTYLITGQSQAGHANWQTDTGLGSPAGGSGGATGKPDVGDCVLWVEEVADTGTIDFSVTAIYETI